MSQAGPDDDVRVPVDVSNSWEATEWLRTHIGRGSLAGYFRRGDEIVYTPREGLPGYVPPPPPMPGRRADHLGPAQVRVADAAHIASYITDTMWPFRLNKENEPIACRFPSGSAGDVRKHPDLAPSLRDLHGVSHTPFARSDGTICDIPGYDDRSGYLYLPDGPVAAPVAMTPDANDVGCAVALLDLMLSEFPFVTPGDRANYIGALLTPLIRELAPPPYKLVIFTAPQRGSGKSYLAEAMRILHGGVLRTAQPDDDDEMNKIILSTLISTTGVVVTFDNVTGMFGSAALDGMLTSTNVTGRFLGQSRDITAVNDRLWTVTGNNIAVKGDLLRRALWVAIDAGIPHPESRTGYAIGDYLSFVRARRAQIIGALLTLVRAWTVNGMPLPEAVRSDQYAVWQRVVSGILSNAGVAGGFDAPETQQSAANTEDDEWRELLETIHGIKGDAPWTAREVLEHRTSEPIDPANAMLGAQARYPVFDALPTALTVKLRTNDPKGAARAFGLWLRNRDGRWADDICARRAGDDSSNTARWRVEKMARAGTAGLTGTFDPGGDSKFHRHELDNVGYNGHQDNRVGGQKSLLVPRSLHTGVRMDDDDASG